MTEPKPYFLFTRTPLHVGAGQSVGYVDLPIQREPHTRIPIVPGSSFKGVLADQDRWIETAKEKRKKPDGTEEDVDVIRRNKIGQWLFGRAAGDSDGGSAGALLIGEARVLCFPVRSAKSSFAWLTCPLALARYARDAKPKDAKGELPTHFQGLSETPKNDSVEVLAGSEVQLADGKVVLEEYTYTAMKDGQDDLKRWEAHLAKLIDDPVWTLLPGRLVIVPDGIFSFYVVSACEIAQHVAIVDETGTAKEGALFNQENVPAETLFYGVVAAQKINGQETEGALDALVDLTGKTIQVGGSETTGLGWCTFVLKHEKLQGGQSNAKP